MTMRQPEIIKGLPAPVLIYKLKSIIVEKYVLNLSLANIS